MDIEVYSGSTLIASGTLTIDSPTSGSFTPTGGTEVTCSSVSWSDQDNGVTDFSFVVSGQANGDFPCGPNGSAYTYNFSGTENSNGIDPSGTVPFPEGSSIRGVGGDPPVWQGDSSEDEPLSRGKAAN